MDNKMGNITEKDYDVIERHYRDHVSKRNGSGCLDLTAYQAIENAYRAERELAQKNEQERFHILLQDIFALCHESGFHLDSRLTVTDLKTGTVRK